ncbi:MAG: hypothetical protein WAN86_18395 [Hyphomicrobiaceae bacterium]
MTEFLSPFTGSATIASTTSSTFDQLVTFTGTAADPPRIAPTRSSPARDLLEIRLISGLTWEELAEVFETTRRSLHNWANGEAMKPENILLVQEVLAAVRRLARSSSCETRLTLLTKLASGQRPLDFLRNRRWADAIAAVHALPPLAMPSSSESRQPHPATYLEARTDTPGPTSGRAIPGRSRRISKASL